MCNLQLMALRYEMSLRRVILMNIGKFSLEENLSNVTFKCHLIMQNRHKINIQHNSEVNVRNN